MTAAPDVDRPLSSRAAGGGRRINHRRRTEFLFKLTVTKT